MRTDLGVVTTRNNYIQLIIDKLFLSKIRQFEAVFPQLIRFTNYNHIFYPDLQA
jgi:hypothetical protein